MLIQQLLRKKKEKKPQTTKSIVATKSEDYVWDITT